MSNACESAARSASASRSSERLERVTDPLADSLTAIPAEGVLDAGGVDTVFKPPGIYLEGAAHFFAGAEREREREREGEREREKERKRERERRERE